MIEKATFLEKPKNFIKNSEGPENFQSRYRVLPELYSIRFLCPAIEGEISKQFDLDMQGCFV
jgi:hypothetical protein